MARYQKYGSQTTRGLATLLPESRHVFDDLGGSIETLEPTCAHCGHPIIGYSVLANGDIYCCAPCARQARGFTYGRRPPDDD